MKKYTVEYSIDASYDLISISTSVTSEFSDPYGAKKLTDKIIAKCEHLSIFPKYSPVKFCSLGKEIRFTYIKNFIIIYYINEPTNVVVVSRIISSHRDIATFLAEDFST